MSMSSLRLPYFIQIAPIAELWRHMEFSRWRPWHRNFTFGFVWWLPLK